jgi:hypothetical protein
MFEKEVRRYFVLPFSVAVVSFITGAVLAFAIGRSGGFPAGQLHGLLFDYQHPKMLFIRFLFVTAFFTLGSAYRVWANDALFEKYKDEPQEQLKLAYIARIVSSASIVICTGFMLGVLDASYAFYKLQAN